MMSLSRCFSCIWKGRCWLDLYHNQSPSAFLQPLPVIHLHKLRGQEMAAPMVRFLATATTKRSSPSATGGALRRRLASSARHDDAQEAVKWERITYLGIATCTVLAIYNLSKGHPHFPDPPPYPYLRIRNKEFPWGPDGLFEKKKHSEEHH